MTYLTRQQLAARFPGGDAKLLQLCDDTKAAAAWTPEAEAVCAAETATAGNTVESYIGTRYALPLADVPPAVTDAVAGIAVYRVFLRAGLDAERDKPLLAEHERIIGWLKDVAKGVVTLPLPQLSASAPQKETVKTAQRAAVFGGLENY